MVGYNYNLLECFMVNRKLLVFVSAAILNHHFDLLSATSGMTNIFVLTKHPVYVVKCNVGSNIDDLPRKVIFTKLCSLTNVLSLSYTYHICAFCIDYYCTNQVVWCHRKYFYRVSEFLHSCHNNYQSLNKHIFRF